MSADGAPSEAPPTQAETVSAWNAQEPGARHHADKDIIQGSKDVTPMQPQPESPIMKGASEQSQTQAFDETRKLGEQAANKSKLDTAESNKKSKIENIKLQLASMIKGK